MPQTNIIISCFAIFMWTLCFYVVGVSGSEDIYSDLEIYHQKVMNKSRLDRHDQMNESVIKIYTTRIQSKKNKNNNFTQDVINEDLNNHAFIDSIMFIYYYGKSPRQESSLIVVGACFAMIAQILTVIIVSLRNRRLRTFTNAFFPITMNFLVMLLLSNLLFIIGVNSNKSAIRCEMIALLLHYLLLTTSVWCFVFIILIYELISNDNNIRVKMIFIFLLTYSCPAIYILFSYMTTSHRLEKNKYCFMSTHNNMIINFLIPIFSLILATTIIGTICLRQIRNKNRDILDSTMTSNYIATGIVMNNGGNIEKCMTDKEILASYYLKASVVDSQLKCCEDHANQEDLNDSKFDLGQLSLADISESSSSQTDYTNFKNATKFAIFFQPVFGICWFFGVIALENDDSYIFPTVFCIIYNILNWIILLKSRNIFPFIKRFYENDFEDKAANEQEPEEEIDEDNNQLARKDSKITKNNKNLINQLFLHQTDQIPLLFSKAPFIHRKSIANLELTQTEYHIEKHKVNSRSEHDLVFSQKIDTLLTDVIGHGRNSWDTNLDRVSTISN